jgi:hypothetical protein
VTRVLCGLEAIVEMLITDTEANPLPMTERFPIPDPSPVFTERPYFAVTIGAGFVPIGLAISHRGRTIGIQIRPNGLVSGGFDSVATWANGDDSAGMAVGVHCNGSSHPYFGLGAYGRFHQSAVQGSVQFDFGHSWPSLLYNVVTIYKKVKSQITLKFFFIFPLYFSIGIYYINE